MGGLKPSCSEMKYIVAALCLAAVATAIPTKIEAQQKTLVLELIPGLGVDATSHYEDPSPNGCQSDEVKIQIQGVQGDFCSPPCTGIMKTKCPTDVPAGVTAQPTCAHQDSSTNKKYCALICSPSSADSQCGTNGSCKSIQSTGVCTYDD